MNNDSDMPQWERDMINALEQIVKDDILQRQAQEKRLELYQKKFIDTYGDKFRTTDDLIGKSFYIDHDGTEYLASSMEVPKQSNVVSLAEWKSKRKINRSRL